MLVATWPRFSLRPRRDNVHMANNVELKDRFSRKVTYRAANGTTPTVKIFGLRQVGEVWKGQQSVRNVRVNRSFHVSEIIKIEGE